MKNCPISAICTKIKNARNPYNLSKIRWNGKKTKLTPLSLNLGRKHETLFKNLTEKAVLRIRIHRIHVFLGLPDPDPLVRVMDPDPAVDPDPDPSIIMQK
jgi:hypothetical protein